MKRMVSIAFAAGVVLAMSAGATAKDTYTVGSGKASAKSEAAETKEEKQAPKPAAKKQSDTLVIRARLLEIPGTFPPNDLYNYVYVMKYRVLDVKQGAYDGREILVGHYNPLIPRKQVSDKMDAFVDGDIEEFQEGDKHELVLVTPIAKVWNEALEDEYFDSQDDKYYALKATVSK
jgi:hypothetical protein